MVNSVLNTVGTSSFMGRSMNLNDGLSRTQEDLSKQEKALAEKIKVGGINNKDIAQNYKEIANAEQMILGSETRLSKIQIVKNRVDTDAKTVDRLMDLAQDVYVTLTSAQQAGAQDKGFGDYCGRKLKDLISILNQRNAQGDSMLGGANRQENAVDPVTGDFLGEESAHAFTLEGVQVQYGFHANEPAIRELVDVLELGQSLGVDDLGPLQDKMQSVTKGLTVIKRNVDEQMLTLESAKEKATEDMAKYKQVYADFVSVDEMQANLDASRLRLMQQALLNTQIESTKSMRDMLAMARSAT